MTALILAGHGSHISPQTAGLVWSYVDQLRLWGVADEITAAFWKETPSLSQVLHTVQSNQVIIVPVFTARGYFSTSVIPAEMGLDGSVTRRGERTIYYTRTLGEHPFLTQIVRQRIDDTLHSYMLDPNQTAVALIGHGTRRSVESRAATRFQADQLLAQNHTAEVVAVYLDDQPDIPSIYDTTHSPSIIAVPFFLAPGSHVIQDVPNALGITLKETPGLVKNRKVYYTPPVGTDEAICRLIVELARDTGLDVNNQPDPNPWGHYPAAGASELIDAVEKRGTMPFGHILLTTTEVRHSAPSSVMTTITTPAALRQQVRENPFRPLAVSDDLPNGWRVPVSQINMLPAIVETIYPGALADWALYRHGNLTIGSLRNLGERQVGMFRDIHLTPQTTVEECIELLCGHCARHATWHYGESPENAIPCPEPCNLWLSRVKEAVAV